MVICCTSDLLKLNYYFGEFITLFILVHIPTFYVPFGWLVFHPVSTAESLRSLRKVLPCLAVIAAISLGVVVICTLNSPLFFLPWHMIQIVLLILVLYSRLFFACCNDTFSPNTRFLKRLLILFHLSISQTLRLENIQILQSMLSYLMRSEYVYICIYVLYLIVFLCSGMFTLYVY